MAAFRLARFGLVLAASMSTAAMAKLPAPSDEAKAKAAEASAKSAWSDKVAAYQLCKSMDTVAAGYYADMKKAGKDATPPTPTPACADPGPFVYPMPAAAAAPAAASAPAVAGAKP
jgi:hypothetical protein